MKEKRKRLMKSYRDALEKIEMCRGKLLCSYQGCVISRRLMNYSPYHGEVVSCLPEDRKKWLKEVSLKLIDSV